MRCMRWLLALRILSRIALLLGPRMFVLAVQILMLTMLRTLLILTMLMLLLLILRLRLKSLRLVRRSGISRQIGIHVAAQRAETGNDVRLKRLRMRCMHLVL